MARKNKQNSQKRLFRLIIPTCLLLIAVAVATPHLPPGLFRNQFRLNPNAKIRADEAYHLRLWVEKPNLPDPGPWQTGLEQALADFRQAYPNIDVAVAHLAASDADERLGKALAEGNPPDLFFSANEPQGYLGDWQLPLSRFVDKTERLAWPDRLWQQMQRGSTAYSLPVAALPRVLMANNRLLRQAGLETADIAHDASWNWTQLIAAAEKMSVGKVKGYVPSSTGETLLFSLAASIGKPAPIDLDGQLLWTKADLISLADTWQRLSHSKGAPASGGNMDINCLDLFLSQKAAIIGPLNHQLTYWLWQAATAKGIELKLLGLPGVAKDRCSDIRVLGISLFRQQAYQGDSHTRAAAELAQHLAPHLGQLLSSLTGALPATAIDQAATWLPYDQESFQAYAEVAQAPGASYAYGPSPGLSKTHWQLIIVPAWEKLVQGDYTVEQFAGAVLAELELATIAAP